MATAPPEEQEKCANCKFWRQNLCRANPPYLVLSSMAAHATPVVAWPETQSTDWCGRFIFKGLEPQPVAREYPVGHPAPGPLAPVPL